MRAARKNHLAAIALAAGLVGVVRAAGAQPPAEPATPPATAASRNVFAPIPPETTDERPFRLPPRGPAEAVYGGLVDIATAQRTATPRALGLPPMANGPEAPPWLPNVRVGLPPPGETIVARPEMAVSLRLVRLEPVNTQVAEARGLDGALIGVGLTFPWMIP